MDEDIVTICDECLGEGFVDQPVAPDEVVTVRCYCNPKHDDEDEINY